MPLPSVCCRACGRPVRLFSECPWCGERARWPRSAARAVVLAPAARAAGRCLFAAALGGFAGVLAFWVFREAAGVVALASGGACVWRDAGWSVWRRAVAVADCSAAARERGVAALPFLPAFAVVSGLALRLPAPPPLPPPGGVVVRFLAQWGEALATLALASVAGVVIGAAPRAAGSAAPAVFVAAVAACFAAFAGGGRAGSLPAALAGAAAALALPAV